MPNEFHTAYLLERASLADIKAMKAAFRILRAIGYTSDEAAASLIQHHDRQRMERDQERERRDRARFAS